MSTTSSGSDGHNHNGIQTAALAVTITAYALAIVTTALRILSRVLVTKHIGPGDVSMILAAVIMVFHTGTTVVVVHWGVGLHSVDVPLSSQLKIARIHFCMSLAYLLSLFLLKHSILAVYRHLSPDLAWRRLVLIVMMLNAAFTVGMMLLSILQCAPIRTAWVVNMSRKTCLNPTILVMMPPAFNLATDIIILVMPVPVILKLNCAVSKKIKILITLGIGFVSILASVVRYALFGHMLTVIEDRTWTHAQIAILSSMECGIAAIAANTPAIAVLCGYLLHKRKASRALANEDGLGNIASYEMGGGGVGDGNHERARKKGVVVTQSQLDLEETDSAKELWGGKWTVEESDLGPEGNRELETGNWRPV